MLNSIEQRLLNHLYKRSTPLSKIEKETSTKGILLSSETMLCLLFKKLSLARSFLFTDFEDLISAQTITMENIDKVYSESRFHQQHTRKGKRGEIGETSPLGLWKREFAL